MERVINQEKDENSRRKRDVGIMEKQQRYARKATKKAERAAAVVPGANGGRELRYMLRCFIVVETVIKFSKCRVAKNAQAT